MNIYLVRCVKNPNVLMTVEAAKTGFILRGRVSLELSAIFDKPKNISSKNKGNFSF